MILHGKVSIVTGGGRGIGKAIATGLHQEGSRLVLASRSVAELEAAQQEVRGAGPGGEVEVCRTDVSKEEDVARLVDFTLNKFSTVDILVNCAGIYGPIGLTTEVDTQEWVQAIQINLFGTFLCMKAVLPIMMDKNRGKIVNLSGGGAASPFPRFSAYASSKAAVVRLTETVAQEVRDYHIDINVIAPGPVNTRLLEQALEAGERAGKDFLAKSIRQKEEGGVSTEKVAELAVFLASPRSDGLSGRFISLLWDNWQDSPQHLSQIMSSDIYTLRRIIPSDRGFDWGPGDSE